MKLIGMRWMIMALGLTLALGAPGCKDKPKEDADVEEAAEDDDEEKSESDADEKKEKKKSKKKKKKRRKKLKAKVIKNKPKNIRSPNKPGKDKPEPPSAPTVATDEKPEPPAAKRPARPARERPARAAAERREPPERPSSARAVDRTRPPRDTSRSIPRPPQGSPPDVTRLLNISDLTQHLKVRGWVSMGPIPGIPPTKNYNSILYLQPKQNRFVTVQLWQFDKLELATARWNELLATYPNAETLDKMLTRDAFFWYRNEFIGLVYLVPDRHKVVSISCHNEICTDTHLYQLAVTAHGRAR